VHALQRQQQQQQQQQQQGLKQRSSAPTINAQTAAHLHGVVRAHAALCTYVLSC